MYKEPVQNFYFEITDQNVLKDSSGKITGAIVTYDTFESYIRDADEQKYVGVLKLGTFTELVDMNNRWSSDQVWEPKKML